MHDIALPVFNQKLGALGEILNETQARADARELDGDQFLAARLSPDMYNMATQVRQATDHVQRCVAKLTGIDELDFGPEEETMEYCQARIAKTLEFIQAVPADKFDGTEDKPIELQPRVRLMHFPGRDYLLHLAFPKFLFHVTTAHDIARNAGIALGKRHYLGAIPQSE